MRKDILQQCWMSFLFRFTDKKGDLRMNTYQILCLAGIPALISGATGYVIASYRKQKSEMKALKSGVQSLLRNELLKEFKEFSKKGYAQVDDRDNFENMYKQYHNLGENGVMDDVRMKFLALPTSHAGSDSE